MRNDDVIEALLRDVMAGLGQDAETASTLPPAAYTSQTFFDLEMAKIFRREWTPVGHIAQVSSVGDYFTIDVLNELLMVVRGADRIRVLSRTCLHRWAPVAAGAGNTKRFSCPFHLWAYELNGQLVSAPLMNHAKDFEPKRHSLPEIRSEIVGGTIYISFLSTARSIGDVLADHTRALADCRPSDMQLAYSVQFDLPFNCVAVGAFAFRALDRRPEAALLGASRLCHALHLHECRPDFIGPAFCRWRRTSRAGCGTCWCPPNRRSDYIRRRIAS